MRILLVEDEPSAAIMLAKVLREEAYAVDMAADGERALELASFNGYDLVILDVMLPRKDGFEVCRELRAGGRRCPRLPPRQGHHDEEDAREDEPEVEIHSRAYPSADANRTSRPTPGLQFSPAVFAEDGDESVSRRDFVTGSSCDQCTAPPAWTASRPPAVDVAARPDPAAWLALLD